MTQLRLEFSPENAIFKNTSGTPAALNRRRVPTGELEKIPRWLAWTTKRCADRKARTTKLLGHKQTAAPDRAAVFYLSRILVRNRKATHHETNSIHPHPTGQSGPPPLEQQRHFLVPLHPPSSGLHQAPRAPKPRNPLAGTRPQTARPNPPPCRETRSQLTPRKIQNHGQPD